MAKFNRKNWVWVVLGCVILVVGLWFIWPQSPTPTPEETPTTKLLSSFTLIDYNTGEDVSWVEISVWTEDPDDLPFDAEDDPHRLSNFDEKVSSQDAGQVEIDLRGYNNKPWLQIDPDYESDYGGYNGVFNPVVTDDFRPLYAGVNYDYLVYVYHLPSNISINVLDIGNDVLDEWDLTSDIHGLVVLDMPYNSTDGLHAGDDGGDQWDIDDEEVADMTADELLWLRDQNNFRTIATFYDLNDDLSKDYDENLELWTNCFGIRYLFNESVSEKDDSALQVNFTLYERDYNEEPAEVIYSAESIYVVYYEPIVCYLGDYSIEFDIALGVNISCTSVTVGRIFTPYDDDNLGAWTLINTAPL